MGFRKPDLDQARLAIGTSLVEIKSPYNDGYTSAVCKHELWLLKCWLEDEYARLPQFSDEPQWQQQRIVDILVR